MIPYLILFCSIGILICSLSLGHIFKSSLISCIGIFLAYLAFMEYLAYIDYKKYCADIKKKLKIED